MAHAAIPLAFRNVEPDLRHGYCRCGCGSLAPVPKHSDISKGWVGGVPLPYRNGHTQRKLKRYDIDPATGCWNWLVMLNPAGYASTRINGKTQRVHKLLYEIINGPVPKGLELDHTCRNRRCINPDHLEPVTHAVNMQRGKITKLTEDQVRRIRLLSANGYSQYKVAAMIGISRSAVAGILMGRRWRNVK